MHAAVRAGGAVRQAVPRRIRRRRLDLATTPGRLWLLLIGLVTLSLAWGALSSFTALHYSSAASSVVNTREQLSLAAQQIYSRLSDADDAATTAFLTIGPEPAATRQRYLTDIAVASGTIESATAQVGDGGGSAARDLAVLATGLPTYTQEMGNAEADNRLALPLGAAYLRESSGLMRDTLLGKAEDLYAAENANLGDTSAEATGLPLIVVTLVAGLGACYLLFRAARWLRGRTNRVLNAGLVAACVLLVVSVAWLAAAYLGARGDLMSARARGSATVAAVAQVDIAAQEAHADESLTLIDNTGYDSYQADYLTRVKALGPGPGTLLTAASAAAAGTPAGPAVQAAVADAKSWFAADATVRSDDDNGKRPAAVASALGARPGDAGAAFARLSGDLSTAIDSDQAVFNSTARSASSDYTGLEAVTIAVALLMAAACAWGLSRRLAEYR
ncbi:MAG: hypothetical protein ACRDP7_38785 [Trebonia sp.]